MTSEGKTDLLLHVFLEAGVQEIIRPPRGGVSMPPWLRCHGFIIRDVTHPLKAVT
jgi:hypothetical protein